MVNFIDFPIFDGVSGDLKHWILWLEEFFVRERFTAMEKMNLAQSLLAGEAESWFYSQKRSIFRSWEHLIDLMIWWFGDVNEFGDFSDPELLRLWDKNDRILQARRVEKRRKRMKATSIPEKVTIWDTETEALIPTDTIPVMNLTESRDSISATKLIQEANSAPVMDGGVSFEKEISCQAVEYIHTLELFPAKESMENAESSSAKDDSITQTQVPVSSLEPGLSFSSEILDVSVAWPSEMVSINRVHSQAGLDCVKNKNNAHHVFDELFRILHDPGGQKDEHSDDIVETEVDIDNVQRPQVDTVAESVVTTPDNVADSVITAPAIVASSSNDAASSTDVITKRQRWDEACDAEIDVLDGTATWIVTSQPANNIEEAPGNRLFAIKQNETVFAYVTAFAELSTQVIGLEDYQLEQLFSNGLQTEMKEVLKLKKPMGLENQKPAVLRIATFTSTHVASVNSLSFAVGTAANWSSGLSQNRQVWEPGGVLSDHVLVDNVEAGSKGLAYAGCVILGINCAGLGSGKEELLATGQQMQRTDLFSELTCSQNKKQMLGYKTRMFKYKSSLRITRSASRDMNQFVGFMKFLLKHKWRSKHLHTISALGFYLSSVFSTVPSATSGRLQGLLEQILQKDDEAYPQILDKLQLNLKQEMDVHGASGLRLFLCQQKFSSIWHRWRRKDSDLEVQLKERALVQSFVSPELLDEAVWIPEVGCRELLVKWQDHDASENFWMFSKDFVQLYPSSKLEDKLVFEGGSIDTIKQSYYRKKKPWVETEGFSCKEALEGNRGFAVSLEV